MKIVKILGTGCPKCKLTTANAEEAVKQTGVAAQVIKVEDIQDIMAYDVLSTPAVVIDEVVAIKGRVPTVEEIKALILN